MSLNTTKSALTRSSQPHFHDIRHWFAGPLGQQVVRTESAMLDQLLPSLFGYHLAQLSMQHHELFSASPIQHKFNVNMELDEEVAGGMVSRPVDLPLANDSIDVVLLHHLLDFVRDPKDVLREITRVTIPMGHVVIVGFNPLSSWGVWKTVARFRGRAPWTGQFIRPGRLMDWLNLLDFKIDRAQYAIYTPPLARFRSRVTDYSQGVSRNLNLPVGSVYVIVARKHVGAVRPVRPQWTRNRAFGGLSVVNSVEHDGLTSTRHPDGND